VRLSSSWEAPSGCTEQRRWFSFGDHGLDIERGELRREAEQVAVEPPVFDLLV